MLAVSSVSHHLTRPLIVLSWAFTQATEPNIVPLLTVERMPRRISDVRKHAWSMNAVSLAVLFICSCISSSELQWIKVSNLAGSVLM